METHHNIQNKSIKAIWKKIGTCLYTLDSTNLPSFTVITASNTQFWVKQDLSDITFWCFNWLVIQFEIQKWIFYWNVKDLSKTFTHIQQMKCSIQISLRSYIQMLNSCNQTLDNYKQVYTVKSISSKPQIYNYYCV